MGFLIKPEYMSDEARNKMRAQAQEAAIKVLKRTKYENRKELAMTDDIPQQYFERPFVAEFEYLRSEARNKRRITFDCRQSKVFGKHVRCARGHSLRGLLSLTTLAVLRGTSSSECKVCPDYDDSEEL